MGLWFFSCVVSSVRNCWKLPAISPPDAAVPPRPLPRQHEEGDGHDWHAEIAVNRWRNADHRDWWDLADRIRVPTLVLGGQQSHLPQDRMRDLAGRLPDATFADFDLGHGMHEERPGEVLTVVEPFLSPLAK